MKRILLMLLSCFVMISCTHNIYEYDKGIIVGIDKCTNNNLPHYKVRVKGLDKDSFAFILYYYTNTEYRIGDTVTLCVTPQQNNTNDTTKIN